MAVAIWQQVATALGRPVSAFTNEQKGQITWWLSGIERLIIKRFGDLSGLDEEDVVYVEVEAVAEKVRRLTRSTPESSITVSTDGSSVTRRYENTPVSADDITDDWWDLLSPDTSSDAFTINPIGGRLRRADNAAECP